MKQFRRGGRRSSKLLFYWACMVSSKSGREREMITEKVLIGPNLESTFIKAFFFSFSQNILTLTDGITDI